MIETYFKSGWRNIIRQKWLSFINVFGLAVGIAASIMLFIYIRHEIGYDKFHDDPERIYRVISSFGTDEADVLPRTFPGAALVLKDQSPLVDETARIKPEYLNLRISGQVYRGHTTLMTDPSFEEIFDFPVIAGDLHQTLSDPHSIAITRELAEILFGQQNPISQTLEIEHQFIDEQLKRMSQKYITVKVGAVMETLPQNSMFQFSVLRSYESYDPTVSRTFSNDVFVFLKSKNVLTEEHVAELSGLIKNYTLTLYGEEYRDRIGYSLQALTDIHFGRKFGYDMGPRGNKELISIFGAVALFILFIAIINFINLVTARSEKRAVEAAIRKVSGAERYQIILQFLGEAIMVSFMALLLALLLSEIFISPFADLLNRELSLQQELSFRHIILFISLAPIIGLLAGMYPAMLFAGYNPVQILRGKARGGSGNPLLRIVLVVIQFGITVILIITILVFNRQIDHMKNANLGFSAENIMVFGGLSDRLVTGYDALKSELLMLPGVVNVSASQAYPGVSGSGMSLRKAEDPAEMNISANEYRTSRDFQETFGIKIKHGRWFDYDSHTDIHNFIVNETAVKALGLENPVGQKVIMWQREGEIIGVAEDFHYSSLKNEISPLVLSAYSPAFYFISVKLSGQDTKATIEKVKSTLLGFDPNFNINERYLDAYFKALYKQEENNNKILTFASALAVIIAMMGILGLSSYIIVSRTKEIGVRKVMGASVWQIIAVLFKDITRWVLLANLIAWPIAWWVMTNWLEGFPYRIHMSVWFLAWAGILSMLIVALTISGQTFMAARKNPVDALRGE
jgi:putative ABC transport system permease protein